MAKNENDCQWYLGIDPGQSGGLAVLEAQSQSFLVANLIKMPPTEKDIWDWINLYNSEDACIVAVIEKVHAMPGNGSVSMFKFGMGFGGLKMALCAAGISYEEVSPQAWQKALGIAPRKKKSKKGPGEPKNAFKQRLRAFAQKLFPKIDVKLETADALLIALYCYRKYNGLL